MSEQQKQQYAIFGIMGMIILVIVGTIVGLIMVAMDSDEDLSDIETKRNTEIAGVQNPDDLSEEVLENMVEIVEFSDFNCGYCKNMQETLKILKSDPELDKQFRLIYRHFVVINENSKYLAKASESAGEQNKFWEMHDLIFQNQDTHLKMNLNSLKAQVEEYAKSLNLDIDKFKNDIDSDKIENRVEKDIQDARDLGVTATPTLFLNGKKVQWSSQTNLSQEEQLKLLILEAQGKNIQEDLKEKTGSVSDQVISDEIRDIEIDPAEIENIQELENIENLENIDPAEMDIQELENIDPAEMDIQELENIDPAEMDIQELENIENLENIDPAEMENIQELELVKN